MSVRQYIGARYVPKFFENPNGSAEWIKETTYEPLTIVTYLGNSYTSKKPVPLNTEITNTEYWSVTGNYNAQVEQYRQETLKVANDIKIEATNRTNADNALSTRLSRLENRKIIMIGDSYGIQNDGSVSKFYWEFFRDALGLIDGTNFFHSFQSGAGFGNKEYLYQLQNVSSSITDKESITDIFVCGGWNDSDKSQSYGTDEEFNDGVFRFNDYIVKNYPKARMTLAHISWGNPQHMPTVYSQMKVSMQRYAEQSSRGWRILSGTEHILHRYESGIWQSDYAHPSQLGQGYLGMYLPSAFLGGSCDINYFGTEHTIVIANTDFTLEGANRRCYENLNGNQYNLDYVDEITMHSATGVSIRTDASEAITAFGSDFNFGLVKENSTNIAVPCRLFGNNKWYAGSAKIALINNLVKIYITVIDANAISESMTVNYIIIPPLHFSIPFTNC